MTSSIYDGKWLVPEIPNEFNEILKLLGYSKIERHVFKKSTVYIHSELKNDILTIKIDCPMYKRTKTYPLNNDPIIYVDDKKNQIIEISGWLNEDTVQTKTMFPEKGITLVDTRQLTESGDCLHKLDLYKGVDDPINVELIYTRVTEE